MRNEHSSMRAGAIIGLFAVAACSPKPSPSDAGTDAGHATPNDGGMMTPSGTCFTTCDAMAMTSTCSGTDICVAVWQLMADATPLSSMSTTDPGVCVPAGNYANNCATASTCSNGLVCTAVPVATISSRLVDTTFNVAPHMLAAVEMQIAGEPLAESMGRSLAGYSRDDPTPNIYFDPSSNAIGPWIDLIGFGTAVESYEYSKQPMNNLNFESGAGISLLFGPLVNPMGVTGMPAVALLAAEELHLADEAATNGVVIPCPATDGGSATPDGGTCRGSQGIVSWNGALPGEPPNLLGWPGFWPTMHPYELFDPTIQPSHSVNWLCTIASDDTPGATNSVLNEDYECDYTTLHLPNRSTQITFDITPGASGWAGWKSALWVMNYLQIMHDSQNNSIASVPAADLSKVGTAGNTVLGTGANTGPAVAGTYLGSSTIEGFQAGNMILMSENQAQHWMTALTTTDGATLSGFPATASLCTGSTAPNGCDPVVMSALQYDWTSPLRWIPGQIAVTETPDSDTNQPFPVPTGYSIASSASNLLDLDGLLGTYSSMYALTDRNNTQTGGSQPAEIYFDGDPFPQDDGMPNGEPTLHDRSLAMMRFIVTNIDRLHRDPATNILVDQVTFAGGTPTRGTTVATSTVTYSLVALRNVRRSLASLLTLYSNTTPDEAVTSTPLDMIPFNGAPNSGTFAADMNLMINTQAQLLLSSLTTADGHAYDGWNLATSAPIDTTDTLDSYTAAIRGLITAYLCTGDQAYRTRAVQVFDRMDNVFYDAHARMYSVTAAPAVGVVPYTPMRFAMLEGSLRDLWEMVGTQPGELFPLGELVQIRLQRLIKLVLNGWDDANTNESVDYPATYPAECTDVDGGIPRGGLQMAERALSGELGSVNDDINQYDAGTRVPTTDREHDCVADIAVVHLPSALANEVDFTVVQP